MEESKEESDSITLNSIYNKYFKEAYECYKKSLDFTDISKTKSLIYFKLGKIGTDYLKKYEEAENYLTEAINDGESFFSSELLKECISKRAQLYRLTGQNDKRNKDIEKLREIDSRDIKSLSNYIPVKDWWEVYPQGVTELIFNEKNKKIIQRIVIKDKNVDIYQKTIHPWGAVYQKNGMNMGGDIWEIEMKSE